jgi:hypothetical protein
VGAWLQMKATIVGGALNPESRFFREEESHLKSQYVNRIEVDHEKI